MRRGNTYQGIILDPPSYGHGPNGEKWKLEDNIAEMMDGVKIFMFSYFALFFVPFLEQLLLHSHFSIGAFL